MFFYVPAEHIKKATIFSVPSKLKQSRNKSRYKVIHCLPERGESGKHFPIIK